MTDFLDWARRVPRLANPADVIAWNTDKRYLAELAAARSSGGPDQLARARPTPLSFPRAVATC